MSSLKKSMYSKTNNLKIKIMKILIPKKHKFFLTCVTCFLFGLKNWKVDIFLFNFKVITSLFYKTEKKLISQQNIQSRKIQKLNYR